MQLGHRPGKRSNSSDVFQEVGLLLQKRVPSRFLALPVSRGAAQTARAGESPDASYGGAMGTP